MKNIKNTKSCSLENTYKVYSSDGSYLGDITFIKYSGRIDWLIKEVSPNLPVMLVDYNASSAMEILIRYKLTWVAGKTRATFPYS